MPPAGRSASHPAPHPAPMRNPPQPVHQAPPPAPVQIGGSILGGIGSTIVQSMVFGTGSAIAHRAVDDVVGPRTIQQETVVYVAAAAVPAAPMSNVVATDACAVHQAPPPAPVQIGGSILGGIGSTIDQSMVFGTGSAIAHRAVDVVVGPRTIQYETVVSVAAAVVPAAPMGNAVATDACGVHSKAFQDCINNFGSDISKCHFYLDMLNECCQGSGASFNA